MTQRAQNLLAIDQVSRGLKKLSDEVAFVGGCAMAFYLDDAASEDVRYTDDVDCIIELVKSSGLPKLEKQLRALGFSNHPTSSVICRWFYQGLTVDIMPTSGNILGFTNAWYGPGWKARVRQMLPSGKTIWRLPFVYFFATKTEAFVSRGIHDWAESKDLEDIIALRNEHLGAVEELLQAPLPIRGYISEVFTRIVDDEHKLRETIEGHLLPGDANQRRAPFILRAFKVLQSLR